VIRREDGSFVGVEAVIDKDRAGALLARELGADAFLMLTDVEAVFQDWGEPGQKAIGRTTPAFLQQQQFATGSMGPKVEAACEFVLKTGGVAGIGKLDQALAILEGWSGTLVTPGPST
jgi:carbamate kinase